MSPPTPTTHRWRTRGTVLTAVTLLCLAPPFAYAQDRQPDQAVPLAGVASDDDDRDLERHEIERMQQRITTLEALLETLGESGEDAQRQETEDLRRRVEALESPIRSPDEEEEEESDEHPFELSLGGYGEFQFAYHDFGPDQTQTGGSAADHRGVFDLTRFAIELEGELPYGI